MITLRGDALWIHCAEHRTPSPRAAVDSVDDTRSRRGRTCAAGNGPTVDDMEPTTLFTVRCEAGHALAKVDEWQGRHLLVIRTGVAELGPHSSILDGDRTAWSPLGGLDEEADDFLNFTAACDCGVTMLNAATVRDDFHACTNRKRQHVVAVTHIADPTDIAVGKTSTLGVAG